MEKETKTQKGVMFYPMAENRSMLIVGTLLSFSLLFICNEESGYFTEDKFRGFVDILWWVALVAVLMSVSMLIVSFFYKRPMTNVHAFWEKYDIQNTQDLYNILSNNEASEEEKNIANALIEMNQKLNK